MDDFEVFELGDIALQRGATLREARLAYKTYGTLNDNRDNAIVYPSWYSGRIADNEWLIGRGMALDPDRYFIIVPCLLGNGQSSSPVNTPPPYDRARFPLVTLYDNVTLQHRLVTEQFGIERLALVTGWSMGAQQSFQWGALFPDMVERILPFCGSARTSVHNVVFLEGVLGALRADAAWQGGWYETEPATGLRAAARVYAGWGFSQEFYRHRIYEQYGFSSLEDFLVAYWEGFFLDRDANNLIAMARTWQAGDISTNPRYEGDFDAALAGITANAIVMPAHQDLYFPPEDSEYEVSQMPNAEFRAIPGAWGHFAGVGMNPEDTAFIDAALKELLAS